jgi:hypothetical protein
MNGICLKLQRMNIIKFILVVIIALVVADLSYHQVVNGQSIEDMQKENCESIQGTYINGKCMIDKNLLVLRQQLEDSIIQLQAKQQGFESILNYCFQHADRPNPLQDLIDKGLMSSNMTGITCKDVKQMSDINQNQISVLQDKINQVAIK